MTCGIYLGILLICFPQVLQVCCSWALQEGKAFWTDNTNSPVVHGRFKVGSPQDEFRHAHMVEGSSADTRVKQRHYSEKYTASQTRRKLYLNSLLKPRWHSVDFSRGNVPPKQGFGRSSSMAGISVSDSSNQPSGSLGTLPGQQDTQNTGQYAPSQPDLNPPTASPHQPSTWTPQSTGKVHKKPGLDTSPQLTGINGNGGFKPPKEFRKPTSGLAWGRKVYLKNGFTQQSSAQSLNPLIPKIQPYEIPMSQHFGLQQSSKGSAYNKNPQMVSMKTGLSFAHEPMSGQELQSERPDLEEQFAPVIIHHIPWSNGGHPIRRLGDVDEEPMEQTTTTTEIPKKMVTLQPTNTYTLPPRQRESNSPRPSNIQKIKWIRIQSSQLTGLPGLLIRTL